MPDESFEFHLGQDGWITVRGGGLQQSVDIRASFDGTDMRLIAMRIDGGRTVDSTTLRSIRPGQLTAELLRFVREESAAVDDLVQQQEFLVRRLEATDERGVRRPFPSSAPAEMLTPLESEFLELYEVQRYREALADAVTDGSPGEFAARGRGAKPPTDGEYRRFAAIYLEELTERPHGAKKRTAERVAMDRGTAYRWIRECQARGLVPPENRSGQDA